MSGHAPHDGASGTGEPPRDNDAYRFPVSVKGIVVRDGAVVLLHNRRGEWELPGGKLRVEIRTNGAGAGPQPAHIHQGTCANLDPAPKFSLAPLTNGASTTELDGSIRDITSAPHAIHLHKAPDELPVYVACADIKLDAGTAGQPPVLPRAGDASSPAGLAGGLIGVGLIIAGLAVGRRARPAR